MEIDWHRSAVKTTVVPNVTEMGFSPTELLNSS